MSESTPEFKPGGGVPAGPQYATRESLGPIVVINTALAQLAETREAVNALTQRYDTEEISPDAMTVTFDHTTET